jgi:hypothetical protein
MHIPRMCIITMQLDVTCYILEVQFQFRSICDICGAYNGTRLSFYSNILICSAIRNSFSVPCYFTAAYLESSVIASAEPLNQFCTCYLTLGWTEIRHVRFQYISERNCCGFSDADLLIYIVMFTPLSSLLGTHMMFDISSMQQILYCVN